MALREVVDQSGVGRLPPEQVARDLCRGGAVDAPEAADEAEVLPDLLEDAGGDHERLAGAGERLAERVDGCAVGVGGAGEVAGEGDVVLELEVDDAVGRGGGLAQRAEVVERPRARLGSLSLKGLGRGVGAGEPGDLVAGGDQFGDQAAADEARPSGDEDAQGNLQDVGCRRGIRGGLNVCPSTLLVQTC